MKTFACMLALCLVQPASAQDSGAVLRQSYNGKFGFYRPAPALSNGLAFGVDGMTEFVKLGFYASLGADLYLKQSFNPFDTPPPQIEQQSLILIPIMLSAGLKVVDVADADTRIYLGAGGGYTLFFYKVVYSSGSGGFLDPGLGSTEHDKSSGTLTGSLQARVVVGKIFLEPKLYFAGLFKQDVEGGHRYTIDPSGFIITLGYSYK